MKNALLRPPPPPWIRVLFPLRFFFFLCYSEQSLARALKAVQDQRIFFRTSTSVVPSACNSFLTRPGRNDFPLYDILSSSELCLLRKINFLLFPRCLQPGRINFVGGPFEAPFSRDPSLPPKTSLFSFFEFNAVNLSPVFRQAIDLTPPNGKAGFHPSLSLDAFRFLIGDLELLAPLASDAPLSQTLGPTRPGRAFGPIFPLSMDTPSPRLLL